MRNEERVADIVRSTLTPLIERVLTKKLTQIIDVILRHDREKAKSEIAELRARMAELEAECGYSDQEHFDIAGKRCGRDFYWAAMSVIKPLQDKTSELEAERAELVKEAKKSALMEIIDELAGGYCPPEEKAGIAYAIESIEDSLASLDAAREGE